MTLLNGFFNTHKDQTSQFLQHTHPSSYDWNKINADFTPTLEHTLDAHNTKMCTRTANAAKVEKMQTFIIFFCS